MKVVFLLSFLVLLQSASHAQELLANGSLEDKNICTEYDKECAPEAWFNSWVSIYYFQSFTNAGDGQYFCGVIVGSTSPAHRGMHSFIYTRPLCRLRKGNHYLVSFSAWCRHPVFDSLGVYFSTDDFTYERHPYVTLTPSLLVHEGADTLACEKCWRSFTFDYTATGEEACMVLGSFKRLPFLLKGPGDDRDAFLLYIDKISMQPLDPHELLCKSADSMKTALYNINERHDMLDRRRRLYWKAPPPLVKASPTIEQHIDTLLIPDILFATASAKLNPNSHAVLDSFCTAITRTSGFCDSLVINGHTDSVGSLQYNYKLSADRANAVEKYLREHSAGGLPKIYTRYHAFLQPVAPNSTPEGRTRNRRVELLLYRHED